MGGDGQALTNKRTLLNAAKEYSTSDAEVGREKQSLMEERMNRWKHCPISLEPLESPVVFDLGGTVYSKISVLEYLAARKTTEKSNDAEAENSDFGLRKLSDVREIANQLDEDRITCPITGYVTTSGTHSFVGFWGCGHVVAGSAVSTSNLTDADECLQVECPVCGVESIKVDLMLSLEDQQLQRKKLKLFLRSIRKRPRES